MIQAEGLRKRFGSTQALDGVDLAVPAGTVLGVLGPNGAGKTTAVRILATLLQADSGTALVGGYDVATQPHQVRRTIGLTGQYASVDEDLTGTQNLLLIGQLLGLSSRDAKARAVELLEWFDLADAASRMAKTYSGGLRRRVDLAASLVGRPAVIFLDEPTTPSRPRQARGHVGRRALSVATEEREVVGGAARLAGAFENDGLAQVEGGQERGQDTALVAQPAPARRARRRRRGRPATPGRPRWPGASCRHHRGRPPSPAGCR